MSKPKRQQVGCTLLASDLAYLLELKDRWGLRSPAKTIEKLLRDHMAADALWQPQRAAPAPTPIEAPVDEVTDDDW